MMSEQVEPIETPNAALTVHAVGQLLAEARKKAGLSIEEAAAKLRLGPRQIAALEAGDLNALPGQAFVRGFTRNYAKLLQIDAEPLLAAYRTHAPEGAQGQLSLHSENIRLVSHERRAWLPYVLASVILAVALAAWLAFMDYYAPVEKGEKASGVSLSQPQPKPGVELQLPPAEETGFIQAAPAFVAAPQPAETTAPVAANATLRLAFSETGWASVHDRDGKEIFFKTVPAGGNETITGIPPFDVVIGNVSGTQLAYNGAPVDLAPYNKANVASLTLK